mmetsp:Transcript_35512/g.93361  ORF Transcript_35512/g.93361 Transcript_35512/m.93361 type:complete len:393 (-) Transcript_35512:106-1284(-)
MELRWLLVVLLSAAVPTALCGLDRVGVDPTGAAEPVAPDFEPMEEVENLLDDFGIAATGKVSKSALNKLSNKVAKVPQDATLHAALGLASLRSKATDKEGVRHLRKALELNPGFTGLHQKLATKLVERTPSDSWARNEALELYRAALRIESEDEESYYHIGVLHRQRDGKDKQGKQLEPWSPQHFAKLICSSDDEVCASWRTALRIKPDSWRALTDLSMRLSQAQKKKLRKEAVTLAARAADVAPSRAASHYLHAAAILRTAAPFPPHVLGEDTRKLMAGIDADARSAALTALRRCVRLEGALPMKPPMRAMAYYQMGMLLLLARSTKMDTYTQSLDYLQTAVRMQPSVGEFQVAEKNVRLHVHGENEGLKDKEAATSASRTGDDDDDDDDK